MQDFIAAIYCFKKDGFVKISLTFYKDLTVDLIPKVNRLAEQTGEEEK